MKPLLASAVLVLSALVPSDAHACSCADPTLVEERDRSAAIFIGQVWRLEVVSEIEGVSNIVVSIDVEHVLKGKPGLQVELSTDNGCCYCSPSFKIAERYLFFTTERDGRLETNACTRTRPLREAAPLLEELGFPHLVPGAPRDQGPDPP